MDLQVIYIFNFASYLEAKKGRIQNIERNQKTTPGMSTLAVWEPESEEEPQK